MNNIGLMLMLVLLFIKPSRFGSTGHGRGEKPTELLSDGGGFEDGAPTGTDDFQPSRFGATNHIRGAAEKKNKPAEFYDGDGFEDEAAPTDAVGFLAAGGGGVVDLDADDSRPRKMLEGIDPFTCVPEEIALLQDVANDLVNNTARCESNLGILNNFLQVYHQYIALRLLLATKVNRVRNLLVIINNPTIDRIVRHIPKVGKIIESVLKTLGKFDKLLKPMGAAQERFFEIQFQVAEKASKAASAVHKVIQRLGFPVGLLPGQVSAASFEAGAVDCCVNVPDGFLETILGMNRTMGVCGFELNFEFPDLSEIFDFLADLFDFPILDRLLALVENIVNWIEAIIADTLARLDTQVLLCCSPFAQEVARVVEFAVSLFNLLTCWADSLVTGVGEETIDVIFVGVKDIADAFNNGIDSVNGAVAKLNDALSFDFKFLFNNSTFPSLGFTQGDDGTCFLAVDGAFDIAIADGNLNASFAFILPLTEIDADGFFDFGDIGDAIRNDCREAVFELQNVTEEPGSCCALARIQNGLDPDGLELDALCSFNFECESGRCDGGFGSTCRPKQPVGTSCNEAEDCETGLCFATAAFEPKTCRERKEIGEACSFPGECISGLICDDNLCRASLNLTLCSPCVQNFDCESNRCPLFAGSCYPADGSPAPSLPFPNACECTVNIQCESGRCTASGLLAGLQNKGICMDKLANNATCDKRSDCLSGRCDHRDGLLTEQICKPKLPNCDDSVCNENNDCESGRCARLMGTCYPLGEQAPPGCKCLLNTDCKGTCDKGKCVDKFQIGHSCLFNNECQSLRCDSRVCTVPGADGSSCNENTDCASRRCELSTRTCHPRNEVCGRCNEPSDCLSLRCALGSCYPPTGRAPNGCNCVFGTDCESTRCDPNLVCAAKLDVGGECRGNFDCSSGRCEIDFDGAGFLGICQPELDVCEPCNENSDCKSNRCAGVFGAFVGDCYPPTGGGPEGCKCFFDLDCASRRCENRVCKTKLQLGAPCRRDQDCDNAICAGDTFLGGSNGVCAEKVGVCQPCTSNTECESGRCPTFQSVCYPPSGPAPDGCRCSVSLDCQNTCIDRICTSDRREVCEPCDDPTNCKSNRCALDVCYPPTGSAPEGCRCALNADCDALLFCNGDVLAGLARCRARRDLCEPCLGNDECLSGKCPGLGLNQCYPPFGPAPSGCKCTLNLDCQSGRCDSVDGQLTCQDKGEIGDTCNEDSDCLSRRCAGSTCAEKLQLCEPCGNSGHCESNSCPLLLQECYPPTGGAPEGCRCALNADCEFGLFCNGDVVQGLARCRAKLDLCEPCIGNDECMSGRCPGLGLNQCYPSSGPAPSGCKCTVNLDCISGRCDSVNGVLKCIDREKDGGTCNEDTDCVSLRCVGSTCTAKLDVCKGCGENGDCKSNRCPLALKVCYPTIGRAPAPCKCTFGTDCLSGNCKSSGFLKPKYCT